MPIETLTDPAPDAIFIADQTGILTEIIAVAMEVKTGCRDETCASGWCPQTPSCPNPKDYGYNACAC